MYFKSNIQQIKPFPCLSNVLVETSVHVEAFCSV